MSVDQELVARAGVLRAGRTPFVLATVVRAERPTSARPGDSALVLPDGTMEGFVGGTCAESTTRAESLRLLADGASALLRISPDGTGDPRPGVRTVANPCLSGGALEIFLESVLPPPLVAVCGDGPVARSLTRLAAALEYEVVAASAQAPPPPGADAVVVASHGQDEPEVLTAALTAGTGYVALVASRRRAAAVLAGLEVSDEQRHRVRAPAGLDIGARSAHEIALSIWCEFTAARTSGTRGPGAAADPDGAAGQGCCG
ncbi:xanthine dehydrogenase accessory factor [Pseudonocardia ammonioxydans]|uniref:Xanthine dehydrogenase accessory factor n=1 Tax=Pseudonocardia ammonioxydans TaxID=260086 RepID=A0A1I5D7N5_PSUAM|nr:XdhC family protein [Pseudonocardia ammonioxydans]SFN95137.1 xanthine dehydrogenase accessory factor [Pseudonocardia ammonioxydans]